MVTGVTANMAAVMETITMAAVAIMIVIKEATIVRDLNTIVTLINLNKLSNQKRTMTKERKTDRLVDRMVMVIVNLETTIEMKIGMTKIRKKEINKIPLQRRLNMKRLLRTKWPLFLSKTLNNSAETMNRQLKKKPQECHKRKLTSLKTRSLSMSCSRIFQMSMERKAIKLFLPCYHQFLMRIPEKLRSTLRGTSIFCYQIVFSDHTTSTRA